MPEQTKQIKQTKEPTQQYSTKPGNYNRESGTKTLKFVSVIIAIIVILCISLLILITRQAQVMIR